MTIGDFFLSSQLGGPSTERQINGAGILFTDFNVMPAQTLLQTMTQGLEDRFLGSETGRVIFLIVVLGAAIGYFARQKELLDKLLRQTLLEASEVDDVDADADNQGSGLCVVV